jgi:predicted NAD-dependent protein-ADP-ribosyltransferase YbiA (DUF1768 family)
MTSALSPKIFLPTYFPTGALLPIKIPKSVVFVATAEESKHKMTGFHDGVPDELIEAPITKSGLRILRSDEHPEKMFAVVGFGEEALIVFGRKGLTNFARSDVELLPGVNIFCSEQSFKLGCATSQLCAETQEEFEKVVHAIVFAAKPVDAKKAPSEFKNFDASKWDPISKQYMYQSTVLRCTHEPTFQMFKRCIETVRSMGAKRFLVIEANDGDKLWGVNCFTKPFLEALEEVSPRGGLIEDAKSIFKGKNQLGEVLTDFMSAIDELDYSKFMAELNGVKFAEIV